LLLVLLVILAVVIYFELRFMRSRNKEYIERMMDKDEAFNAIATTKAISETLRQKGKDIKDAEPIIIKAESAYKRGNYAVAKDSAKRAKEILMKAPTLEIAPPSQKEIEPKAEEGRKTVHAVKKLEPHLIESRFIINSCRDRISSAESSGKDLSEAKEHLSLAEKCFEDEKYDEALREGLKARRHLDEVPTAVGPSKEAVLVKVPKPERKCENCSAPMLAEDVFCRKCGAAVTVKRTCAYCRAEMSPEDVFCPKCGRKA